MRFSSSAWILSVPLAAACAVEPGDTLPSDPPEPAQSIGELRWARTFGGAGDDAVFGLTWDAGGAVVVGGGWSSGTDLGAGPLTTAHRGAGFVAAYGAADGAPLWSRPFDDGGSVDLEYMETHSQASAVAAGAGAGGVYVAGGFNRIVDWGAGPHESDACVGDSFVAVHDAGGGLLRSIVLPATGWVQFAPLADGGLFLFARELVSNCAWPLAQPQPAAAAEYSGYLARYDATGTQLWRRDLGPKVWVTGIAPTADGGLAVSGAYGGTADLGGEVLAADLPADNAEGFAARLDGAGNGVWAHALRGATEASRAWASALAVDAAGRIWVTGDFHGEVAFADSPQQTTATSDNDLFLLALADGGQVAGFVQSAGASAYGFAVAVRGEQIAVAGSSSGRDLAGNPAAGDGPVAGRFAGDGDLLGSQVLPQQGRARARPLPSPSARAASWRSAAGSAGPSISARACRRPRQRRGTTASSPCSSRSTDAQRLAAARSRHRRRMRATVRSRRASASGE